MTRRHITHYLDHAHQTLTTIHEQFTALEQHLIAWARDGYPTASTNPGGSTNTISDPTAQAVLAPDQVRLDREHLHATIIRLHDLTVTLDNIRRRYLEPVDEQAMTELRKAARCSTPTCDEYAVKAGRCNACYHQHRRAEAR